MPMRIRKKSSNRFEAFLKKRLARFREKSIEPFTESRELLMRRFPEISGREAEEIARKFENKYFHKAFGDSARVAQEAEKAKEELIRLSPEERKEMWREGRQADLEKLRMSLYNCTATLEALKGTLSEFKKKRLPPDAEIRVSSYKVRDHEGKKAMGWWFGTIFKRERLMDEIEYEENRRKKTEEKIKEIKEALKKST